MSKKELRKYLFVLAIGILYILILLKYNIGIPCIFYKITGKYCPGCGATRAIISMITLDFYQSIRYNLFIVVIIPLLFIYTIFNSIVKRKVKIPNYIWYILLVLAITYGIIRNIPIFSFLSPTTI